MTKKIFLLALAAAFISSGCSQNNAQNINSHRIIEEKKESQPMPTEQSNLNSDSSTPNYKLPNNSDLPKKQNFVAGQILAGFVTGATKQQIEAAIKSVNGSIEGQIDDRSFYKINLSGISVEEAIKKINSMPGVKYSEPNFIMQIPDCNINPC